MSNASETPPSPPGPGLDPARASIERRSWQTTTAPKYIGLFLWVVFFDQLGRRTLADGGLMPSLLGVLVAGVLCYLFLYHVPAMWGFRTGQPLTTLGTSTFGVSGSPWLTGVLMGLAQVVWFAAATTYAVDLTFDGLISCRLMSPGVLQPIDLGGLRLPSLPYLVTALTWSYAAAMVGHYLVEVIDALMNVFPAFMALMLAVAMLWTLGGVPQFRPMEVDPGTSSTVRDGGLRAFGLMVQLIFGFFAPAGALAADWGAVNRREADVRLGGWVGVTIASWTVATLSLLTVAGALGRSPRPPSTADFTFHSAVLRGVGGPLGGTILMVFGLGSLAPSCYAAHLYGHRFATAWPRLKRVRWTLLGTSAACLLVVVGLGRRLETVFTLMGAAFAPLVAAMAADYVRHRGAWPGPRRGLNPPGMLAWAVGFAVGLVPVVSDAVAGQRDGGASFQPSAVFAFFAAFLVYLVLAGLGAESPPEAPLPDTA